MWDEFYLTFMAEKFGIVEVSTTLHVRRDPHSVAIRMRLHKLTDIPGYIQLKVRDFTYYAKRQ